MRTELLWITFGGFLVSIGGTLVHETAFLPAMCVVVFSVGFVLLYATMISPRTALLTGAMFFVFGLPPFFGVGSASFYYPGDPPVLLVVCDLDRFSNAPAVILRHVLQICLSIAELPLRLLGGLSISLHEMFFFSQSIVRPLNLVVFWWSIASGIIVPALSRAYRQQGT